jgi:hypothetical protein
LHDVISQKITVFFSYQIKEKKERKIGNISAFLLSYFTVWTAPLQRFPFSKSFLTQRRGILQRRIGHSYRLYDHATKEDQRTKTADSRLFIPVYAPKIPSPITGELKSVH